MQFSIFATAMYLGQIFNTEGPLHSRSSLRYSLTEEGLALAERLESVGTKDGPEGDREEVRSEGDEDEEGGPGVVDLTGSDDDEEEKEEDQIQ